MCGEGYKIVNIQKMSPGQTFTDPKSGNGNQTFGLLYKYQPIAGFFLAADPGNKFTFHKLWAKLPHYRITSGNFYVGCGNANAHVHLF